jgi:hypothetical protein
MKFLECSFHDIAATTNGGFQFLDTWISGCTFYNITGDGITTCGGYGNAMVIENNIIRNCGGNGITFGSYLSGSIIRGNTIYSNSGHGIYFSAIANNNNLCLIENNLIGNHTTSGKYGITANAALGLGLGIIRNNFFYNNANISSNVTMDSYTSITAGDPTLVPPSAIGPNPANNTSVNLGLNNTAAEGVAVQTAALPSAFATGNEVSYLDGGAVQHQNPSNVFVQRNQIVR